MESRDPDAAAALGDAPRTRTRQSAAIARAERAKAEEELAKAINAEEMIEYNSSVANVQVAGENYEHRKFDRVSQRLNSSPERLRG